MLLHHVSRKVIVSGNSGSGKSTFGTHFLLNSWQTIYGRTFIFDHEGEFAFRLSQAGQPVIVCTNEDELCAELERSGFVVFDPSMMFEGDLFAAWDFFCAWCFMVCKQFVELGDETKSLLFCDELQKFSSTSDLGFDLGCVIETGRRYGLDFFCITQQINLLNNRLRNQVTELVSFRTVDPYVLELLEKRGFNPQELVNLQVGQYVLRNFRTGEMKRNFALASCESTAQNAACDSAESSKSPLEGKDGQDESDS